MPDPKNAEREAALDALDAIDAITLPAHIRKVSTAAREAALDELDSPTVRQGRVVPELQPGATGVTDLRDEAVPDATRDRKGAVKRYLAGAVRAITALPEFALWIADRPLEADALANAREAGLTAAGLPTRTYPGDVAGVAGEEITSMLPFAKGVRTLAKAAPLVASTVGAIAGRSVAQAAAPDSLVAETVGGLGGGLSGGGAAHLVAGGKGAVQGVGRFVNRLRGSEHVAREDAIRQARKILEQNLPPASRARVIEGIDQAIELEREIPGFRASLGAASGDPNLQALEDSVLATIDPKARVGIAEVESTRLSSQQAVVNAVRTKGPSAAPSLLDKAKQQAQASVDARISDVESRLDLARGEIGADKALYAETRTEMLRRSQGEWKADVDRISSDLDAFGDQHGVRVPTAPLKRAAQRARESVGTFEQGQLGPAEGFLDQIQGLDTYMSFEDLRSAQRQLNNLFDTAEKGTARALAEVRGGVNETKKMLASPSAPPDELLTETERANLAAYRNANRMNPNGKIVDELAQRFNEFNEFYAAGAQRYQEGIAGTLDLFGKRSQFKSAKLLDSYFQPGVTGKQAAEEYRRVVERPLPKSATPEQIAARNASATEAVDSMERWIVASASEQTMRAEGFDGRALTRFLEKYDSALRQFPEARAKVQNLKALEQSVNDLGLSTPRSAEAIQRGALKLFIEDPHAAIRKIVSTRSFGGLRALKRTLASSPEAFEGLKRAYWDVMESEVVMQNPSLTARFGDILEGRTETIHGANFRHWLDRNEKMTDELFGVGHTDSLRRLAGAAEVAGNFPMPQASAKASVTGKSAIMETGRSIGMSRLGSKSVRIARGVQRMTEIMASHFSVAGDRILREAILDMPLARILAQPATAANEKRAIQILSKRGLTLPIRSQQRQEDRRRDAEAQAAAAGGMQ